MRKPAPPDVDVRDKPLSVWTPSKRRVRENEPSIELEPPPLVPPAATVDVFRPRSRAEQIRWAVRYYGFVGGLVVSALAILVLLVVYVLMPPQEEEELTPEAILSMSRQSAPSSSAAPMPVPEREPGILSIRTIPEGAEVEIDGTARGVAPLEGVSLRPGFYLLTLSHPEFGRRDTLIEVAEGMTSALHVALDTDRAGELPTPAPTASTTSSRAAAQAAAPQQRSRASTTPRQAARTPASSGASTAPARNQPRPSVGILAVVSTPPDARVMLNGEAVGTAPLILSDIPVGTHEVLVHAPGYSSVSRRVTVSAGTQETARFTLAALEGTLAVLVRPWGSIYVDGRLLKRETDVLFQTTLPSGFHSVRVEHPVLGTHERSVEVRPGETTRIDFQLEN